ncbi:MAG: hypothetical protein F6K41_07940 [Symploca sp. SIO3E6]|nr:hypothetical protein [Caldora sp. SIO3E6]
MRELVYPTLDLFLYDLKEALNITDEATQKNQEIFTQKLPPNITIVDSAREAEYLELLPQKTEDFQTDQLEGYYYPVRLNDTYGLQINCSVNNLTEPQPVESFSILKSQIESRLNEQPITLGQAWLLSGWLPENATQTPQELAQDCYQAFCKDSNWQDALQGEGSFCDGKIFQLWQPEKEAEPTPNPSKEAEPTPNPSKEGNWRERALILIAIYPNLESAQQSANFYPDWLGLFSYYSKIKWAYAQSRLIKQNIFGYYKKIESDRQKLPLHNPQSIGNQFTELKNSLDAIQQDIKEYRADLLGLAFQKQVIDINLTNYQTRLEIIRKKLDTDSQLDFLEQFSDLVIQKYLVQIDKDSENIQLGFRLLEDNINAVRSRIELAKAERDRNFKEFVAVVGSGIAGVSFAPADKNCDPIFGKNAVPCKFPVLFNLVVFIIVAAMTWLIRKQWKRSS